MQAKPDSAADRHGRQRVAGYRQQAFSATRVHHSLSWCVCEFRANTSPRSKASVSDLDALSAACFGATPTVRLTILRTRQASNCARQDQPLGHNRRWISSIATQGAVKAQSAIKCNSERYKKLKPNLAVKPQDARKWPRFPPWKLRSQKAGIQTDLGPPRLPANVHFWPYDIWPERWIARRLAVGKPNLILFAASQCCALATKGAITISGFRAR